jgi:acyl dehydratase
MTAFAALNDAATVAVPADLPHYTLQELSQRVGQVLGTSPWLTVDQARIDAFAHATVDPQWIHVDPVRAADGPFGRTIAHGFLTLSLMAWYGERAFIIDGLAHSLNYGMNRVRFPAPVPVGSRLRGVFRLLRCEPIEGLPPGRPKAGQPPRGAANEVSVGARDGGMQLEIEATIELEGSAKPACVAQMLTRRYPAADPTPGA